MTLQIKPSKFMVTYLAYLCLLQPCESTQLEFMSQQCSATDQQPLSVSTDSRSVYTWIPAVSYTSGQPSKGLPVEFVLCCFLCSNVFLSLPGDAQCKLMCRLREQDFMVSRGSQFIDGTRCEAGNTVPRGSISACLGGKCQVMPHT